MHKICTALDELQIQGARGRILDSRVHSMCIFFRRAIDWLLPWVSRAQQENPAVNIKNRSEPLLYEFGSLVDGVVLYVALFMRHASFVRICHQEKVHRCSNRIGDHQRATETLLRSSYHKVQTSSVAQRGCQRQDLRPYSKSHCCSEADPL